MMDTISLMLLIKWTLAAALGYPLIKLVLDAWMERDLSGMEATLLLCGAIVLVMSAIARANTFWYPVLLVVLAGTSAGLWLAEHRITIKLGREMLDQDISAYLEALREDPKNAAAHEFLGDAYLKKGWMDKALAEYEASLELMPDQPLVKARVNRLIKERQMAAAGEFPCPGCGHSCPSRSHACPECGRSCRSMFGEFAHWLSAGAWRGVLILAGWVMLGVAAMTLLLHFSPILFYVEVLAGAIALAVLWVKWVYSD